jgi:hypothetical protein
MVTLAESRADEGILEMWCSHGHSVQIDCVQDCNSLFNRVARIRLLQTALL